MTTLPDGRRRGLGRGLSALLGDEAEDYAQLDRVRTPRLVPIGNLRPGRFQPRRRMSDEDLRDLAESIAGKGILQPILVRRDPGDPNLFEIVAGERRWRAAQLARLHEVPILVKDLSDQETLEVALIENLQRQDLSALEEAEGYRRLMDEFAHTQEDLGKALGKSRSHVANTLRLLSLPEGVKTMLDQGELTAGHARALLTATDPEALAREVAKRGLNVRQTERLARQARPKAAPIGRAAGGEDANTLALERDLTALLGLKAQIRFKGAGGTLTLHYGSLEQLDDILHRLRQGARDEGRGNEGRGNTGREDILGRDAADDGEPSSFA